MPHRKIIIATDDNRRLRALLASDSVRVMLQSADLADLQTELDRARVVPPEDVPDDIVTMNSTVELRDLDTNQVETYTLVYPDFADIANNCLSILAPIGTAILGYRVGDRIRWRVPAGWRRLQIESVHRGSPPRSSRVRVSLGEGI
jgi:regulator of nucleoside diphosphate kinase